MFIIKKLRIYFLLFAKILLWYTLSASSIYYFSLGYKNRAASLVSINYINKTFIV